MPMFSFNLVPQTVDLLVLQAHANDADKVEWVSHNATPDPDGVLRDDQGRICLPIAFLPFFVRRSHCVLHVGQRGVMTQLSSKFCILKLSSTPKLILSQCLTCARTHCGRLQAKHDTLVPSDFPFQVWQTDFTMIRV